MKTTDCFELVQKSKLIAILRGVEDSKADQVVDALERGGITIIEATMNTEGATGMISRWRERYEGRLLIGAGTVLDVEMAREAIDAGSQFLISPNFDPEVVAYATKRGIDVYPGVMTPTEIVAAWKSGVKAVKVFPSGSLGLNYIKEIRAPLDRIPMIATGGVNLQNIGDFLAAGVCAIGLGGSLASKQVVSEGRFDEIEKTARAFVNAVESFTAASVK
ncbi:2-dehydro-3-deoxyphosphogluconate aldolase [Paenibacillus swuensis]|uniref:2-dehydro-3-deoxyphosphogluconate aldolase n=1 Tax=Paenibacillus swuensis TaxID=1178515 RepID=A0A172TIX7_9BACL|nr:bifunctional 4-hydroxy-2-oxoglutarate aldolase/2-dehydro-3-deoxy-phosphogluconate aldolase [Paenibacillus swuensis]ANE46960.1 2-dehydro-3-deoxyphosphogluconate aldolase [Paenibacillus swuensis]